MKYLFFGLCLVITCFSCTNINEADTNNLISSDWDRFSVEEVNSIGEMHNYYVIKWIDAFNCDAEDYNVAAVDAYRMIGLEDFPEEDILSLKSDIGAFDPIASQKYFTSSITLELYNDLNEVTIVREG